ncbi:MFS transporter [Microbacterium sorbitolivorans]|uniref:MFS transporter n=2 Tax=Microbacterium sorbitolivorans TaxID=1867410 RepID=A0A367YAU3_9MICO|nr:MFS transporter [Microbacterium sorbitolivorans]
MQPPVGAGIWRRPYLLTTVGAVALIFLAAMQSLAVTTVMPTVAADLGGAELYAVAFSGSFATSIIGMVAAGAWSDRKSPAQVMWAAVIGFAAGLVVCALAPSMLVLVLGRLVMGLGSGGLVVALYVIVARVYPPNLHGRVMASFAAAWVVPSLVGPAGAGAVTEFLHWRWVFAGVAALAAGAFAMLAARLRKLDLTAPHPDTSPVAGRLGLAVVVAIGLLAVSLAGEAPGGTTSSILLAAGGFVVVLFAMRPLVPRGTFVARRGLPSVILTRGLIAGACFGSEIYLPYLLQQHYGFSPTWAGLGLTVGAITWAIGSETSGRWGARIGNARLAVGGAGLLALAVSTLALSVWLDLPAWIPIVFWGFGSLGMGMLYPRTTVLSLAYSTTRNQGFNSSALQISDGVGTSSSMAVMGLVFVAAPAAWAFPAVFGLGLIIALVALIPGLRLGHAGEMGR